MKITLEEVKQKFTHLLADKISREEADRWAYSIIKQEELGNVSFFPSKDKDIILSDLMYLYGIDIQDRPGEYLHTKEDIKEALKEKIDRFSTQSDQ